MLSLASAMVRTSPPTALLLNGVVMSAAFAGLEGCVVACIVISAAIVCPSLAYQANAYLYLFFCVGTFAAPGVLAYTGAKRGMVVGMFCYSLYTAAFLLPRPEVILPASAIAGFAGAVLWTAQGEYFTANALAYAVARSAAAGPLPRLSRAASVRGRGGAPKQQGVISSSGAIGLFAALFAGLFPIFLLLGKLSGSVLLSLRPDEPQLIFALYTAVALSCTAAMGCIRCLPFAEPEQPAATATAVATAAAAAPSRPPSPPPSPPLPPPPSPPPGDGEAALAAPAATAVPPATATPPAMATPPAAATGADSLTDSAARPAGVEIELEIELGPSRASMQKSMLPQVGQKCMARCERRPHRGPSSISTPAGLAVAACPPGCCSVAAMLCERRMLLLSPTNIAFGAVTALYPSKVTLLVKHLHGAAAVMWLYSLSGLASAVFAALLAVLARRARHGRTLAVLLGACGFIAACAVAATCDPSQEAAVHAAAAATAAASGGAHVCAASVPAASASSSSAAPSPPALPSATESALRGGLQGELQGGLQGGVAASHGCTLLSSWAGLQGAFVAHGLGVAAWQGNTMALVADVFRASPRPAFAHLKLTSGMSSAAGFVLLPRLSLQAAALLCLVLVLLGLLTFVRLHWVLHVQLARPFSPAAGGLLSPGAISSSRVAAPDEARGTTRGVELQGPFRNRASPITHVIPVEAVGAGGGGGADKC